MTAVMLVAFLAMPAGAAQGGDDSREALLAQLPPGAADNPARLRQLSQAALTSNDPQRAVDIADLVQPGDKNYGAAQSLKAQALQKLGDPKAALLAWQEAAKDPAQRFLANSNIRLLRAQVEAESGGSAGEAAPGAPTGLSYNGLTSADLQLVSSMFRSQGNSAPVLTHTLAKAARGDARGMQDLRKAGIDFARGPAEQTEAVVVKSAGGVQTVSFSPAVLDNPDKKKAIAQLANGVEQAATQRDFSGIMLHLRQWGGRLVGVLVYLELAPGARLSFQGNRPEDERLVSDAMAYKAAGVPQYLPKLPNGESKSYMYGQDFAKKDGMVDSPAIFLYFCAQTDNGALYSSTLVGDNKAYFDQLRVGGK